jgi:O-methyltransferase domain/IclR helix-turn-helix domain
MTGAAATVHRFDRLAATLGGYELSQMLAVFARLGLPEALARGPVTSEELAEELGLHGPSLHRLLRALSGTRVVARDAEGRFVLTSLGRRLLPDAPDSLRPLAVGFGESWWWAAWGALAHTVRTGETAFDSVYGCSFYEYLEKREDASTAFAECIATRAADDPTAVADHFDFSGIRHIVDVGGGNGTLLEVVLARHPHLRGTLFELPTTLEGAREHLAASPILDRIDFAPGDFFGAIPPGGDLYLLKNVLHNWDDEHSTMILGRVREALGDGRVLVVQHVVPDSDEPSPAKLLDIALLVLTGGKQRTIGEYADIFAGAGLELVDCIQTPSGTSLIEAQAAT